MALSKIPPSGQTQYAGVRNLIINGAMTVAQRGTSGFASTGYTLDRFKIQADNMDNLVFEVSQSTTTPADFSNSLRVEVTTAETALASDELMYLFYAIEAQDLQHINYGSSDAKKLTLSFWVRSSLTGTYSLLAYQEDDTRASTHAYTVNTADTWEYKTITIPADTTGVIDNNNGTGLGLYWTLAAGSNYSGSGTEAWKAYVAATFADSNQVDFTAQTGNFYITGVQLEVGDSATDFEHRSYADELLRCQRYFRLTNDGGSNYQAIGAGVGFAESTSLFYVSWTWDTEMRAAPTLAVFEEGNANGSVFVRQDHSYYCDGVAAAASGKFGIRVNLSDPDNTAGDTTFIDSTAGAVYASTNNKAWSADAEL
jgi:hypothetical protein